jgi:hypothetical protein
MEHRSARSLQGCSLHSVADDMLKTKTYGAGRICTVEGCGTRLSAYNPSGVCALHGGAWQEDFHHGARRSCRMRAFQARVMGARRMGDLSGARRAS